MPPGTGALVLASDADSETEAGERAQSYSLESAAGLPSSDAQIQIQPAGWVQGPYQESSAARVQLAASSQYLDTAALHAGEEHHPAQENQSLKREVLKLLQILAGSLNLVGGMLTGN